MKNLKCILFILAVYFINYPIHAQTFQWAHALNTKNSTAEKIYYDNSGNIIISGNFSTSITDSFDMDFGPSTYYLYPGVFKNNSFIAKYTSNGDLLWAKLLYSQSNDNYISDISCDSNNNILFLGKFTGTLDFDPGPNVFNMNTINLNLQQLFIEKLDSNGNFVWAKTIGDNVGYTANPSFTLTHSGDIIITGGLYQTLDFDPGPGIYTMTAIDNNNTFLLKLDKDGLFVWAKQLSGTTNVGIKVFSSKIDHCIYFIGNFNNSFDANPNNGVYMLNVNGPNFNYYFIKLKENGDFVWARSISTVGMGTNLKINKIIQDYSGNLIYVGYFSGTIDFNLDSIAVDLITSNPLSDAFFSKIDTAGNYIWTKTFGDIYTETAASIVCDANNNYYLGGVFAGLVDFDPGPNIYNMSTLPYLSGISYISKFDHNGNFIDAFSLGTPANQGGFGIYDLAISPQDDIFAVGKYNGSHDFDPSANTHILTSPGVGSYMFISKYSFCGTHYDTTIHACNTINLWGTNYDSSKHFIQYFLNANECDSNMNVNLIKQYGPTDTIQQTVCKNFTINNVTYNSSGVYVQHFPIGAACDSLLIIDLQVTNPGNLTISQIQDTLRVTPTNYTYQWIDCATNLPINGANDTIFVPASPGSYKVVAYFAAGCSDTSSCKTVGKNVGLNEQPIQHIKIYPNPTSETFTISTEGVNHDFKLSITDLLGKILFEQNISPKQNQTISLANFANGAYFIRLENEKINFVEKIIKTN